MSSPAEKARHWIDNASAELNDGHPKAAAYWLRLATDALEDRLDSPANEVAPKTKSPTCDITAR